MLVHCPNCNKNIPLMEIDSNFHTNGLCKSNEIDMAGWSFFDRHSIEIIILITAIGFFGIIYGLNYITDGGIFPEQPHIECMSYHIGTVLHGAGNNLVTYNSPKKICDVELLKIGDSPRAYKYSNEIQEKYNKPFGFTQYTCDNTRLDFELKIEPKTMNLLCPDGSIAMEYHR